jgi:hypothetical protein
LWQIASQFVKSARDDIDYDRHSGYKAVFSKIDMCRVHFEKVGLAADFLQQFIQ